MRSTLRPILVCTAFLSALAGSVAQAGQIVVLDETWVHAPDLADSHYRVVPIAGTPTDWVNPVDYSKGKAWVYLEVHSKPTDAPTKFQVCFEANPTYACTAQSPAYTEVGTYEWETDFAGFWSPPGEFVDWTKGVNKIACILKDTMNGKPSADNVGPETAALYMPTEVRMVVTIVEPGSEYVPPTPSGEGTTGDDSSTGEPETGGTVGVSTGEPDTTGDPPSDTTTTTTAGATTGDPTTGGDVVTTDPGGSSGPAPTTSGTTGPTGPAGTDTADASASDTADSADHGDSSKGCACSSSAAPAPTGLALGLLLLGLVRRRRA